MQVGQKKLRTHNGLLRTFAGADGMKTGFICNSGFNIVVSATREGRKLVAVVLGEPSTRVRNARAAELLENGYKRYFWKSLFGTSLDGLAVQAQPVTNPRIFAEVICGPGPKKRRQRAAQVEPHAEIRRVSEHDQSGRRPLSSRRVWILGLAAALCVALILGFALIFGLVPARSAPPAEKAPPEAESPEPSPRPRRSAARRRQTRYQPPFCAATTSTATATTT